MTTERQVEANRRNAQLSTGPSTSAGKDISRLNALKHGLRAETLILPDEAPEDYRSFRQAILDELTPIGELETLLADRIVLTAWRLRRAGRLEAGLFIRDHYQRVVEQANRQAAQYERNETDQLLASMNRSTITDPAAHAQARERAAEAEALRDADSNSAAATFQRHPSDMFGNLARYETALERSLYKAIHELQRLQSGRIGRATPPPAILDVNVDAGQQLP